MVWCMTHRDTVHQLEAEFADAMNRMYAVGNGLARLRAELDRESPGAPAAAGTTGAGRAQPATAAVPAASPATTAAASEPPAVDATVSGTPAAAALAMASGANPSTPPVVRPQVVVTPRPLPAVPWYRREGAVTRALALTGAVVTLAGVAMFLVLAAQQGWFGPVARVAAGAALAALLAAIGVRNGEAERRRGPVSSARWRSSRPEQRRHTSTSWR